MGKSDETKACICCNQEEKDSTEVITQAAQNESEETIGPEDLSAIVVDGIRRYNSQSFDNLGITSSIVGLHKKYSDLEDTRILVHGLALHVSQWRPPWFRYRRQVVIAYRAAVHTYHKMLMYYLMAEVLDNASQKVMEAGDE